MKLFKWVRFWLVWVLAAPVVLLYLVGAAVRSGQWRVSTPGSIWIKFQLIHQSLYQKFVEEKNRKIVHLPERQ